MSSTDAPDRTYWVSDCRQYIARVAPGDPMPDVVETATSKAWVTSRWKLTGFEDPRCGLPQFPSMPVVWSNLGRRKKDGTWVQAFSVKLMDFDMEKQAPMGTPFTWQAEVFFHNRLPVHHARRRKAVNVAIEAATKGAVTT